MQFGRGLGVKREDGREKGLRWEGERGRLKWEGERGTLNGKDVLVVLNEKGRNGDLHGEGDRTFR